jgi:type I restriction enzyme S subunit
MSEWKEAPLEVHLERITYGFTNPMPTADRGPFMVTARDINHGRILYEQARSTTEEAFQTLLTDKSRPDVGDVLVTKDGTLGRIAVVDRANVCINQSVALLKPSVTIRPRFLKYLLEEPSNFARMIGDADGTTIKHIYITRLAKMKVRVPAIPIQDMILNVVGSLDDKIELNRQMNETLEAMARAIFKDWFVDFGPTRAKMEGLPPYLAPDLWALFPDRFDEEDKPDGWSLEPVYDQAQWVNGAAYKDMDFSSEPNALPVVKIAELKNGITQSTRFTNSDLGERYRINDEELLFSWSGNPDTSIDCFIWTLGQAWLNQHIFAVRSNGKRSQCFLYTLLKQLKSEFAEIARNKQTTGLGHVTQQDLIRLKTVIPSQKALLAFDDVAGPLHARFKNNLFENQLLAQTRDLLLPKLMSGEIRLKEAEKIVEDVI